MFSKHSSSTRSWSDMGVFVRVTHAVTRLRRIACVLPQNYRAPPLFLPPLHTLSTLAGVAYPGADRVMPGAACRPVRQGRVHPESGQQRLWRT